MHEPIILFDGVCNLCNGWVDFVIRRDRKGIFKMASLQSEAGRKILMGRGLPFDELAGIYLVYGEKTHTKSGAVLRIFRGLRGLWPMMAVFLVVPVFIRDAVYDFIAKRRYRWFGKRETCRLPAEKEKGRFLL